MVTEPKFLLTGLTTRCGGFTTTMRFGFEFVLTPSGPLAIKRTEFVPARLYVCVNVVAKVFVVPPSPKLQFRFVIVPVDVSVNVTVNAAAPFVGVALKLATGTIAPLPVIAYEWRAATLNMVMLPKVHELNDINTFGFWLTLWLP